MTLAVAIYIPTGIVLAAESRLMLTLREQFPDGTIGLRQRVMSDNVHKLVALPALKIGVATVGHHFHHGHSVDRLVTELVADHAGAWERPGDVAEGLAAAFDARYPLAGQAGFFVENPAKVAEALVSSFAQPPANPLGPDVGFYVAGYGPALRPVAGDPRLLPPEPYLFYVGANPRHAKRLNVRPDTGEVIYGAAWAGDREVVDRLLTNAPLLPFELMPLDDAIDMAVTLVETAIAVQRFRASPPTLGGPVRVLVITADDVKFVER